MPISRAIVRKFRTVGFPLIESLPEWADREGAERELEARLSAFREQLGFPDTQAGWKAMALRLAAEQRPDLRVVEASQLRRGRRKTLNDDHRMGLLADVLSLRQRLGLSEAAALRVVTTKKQYQRRWGKSDQKTLADLLRAAKNPDQNRYLREAFDGPPARAADAAAMASLIERFVIDAFDVSTDPVKAADLPKRLRK